MPTLLSKIVPLITSQGTVVLANILISVFASRYLSIADYATFRQTFLPYETLVPVLSLGIPGTIYYLLPKCNNKLKLFFDSLLIVTATSLLFALFLIMGGNEFLAEKFNNPALKETYIWLAYYPFLQLPIQLIISVLIYKGATKLTGLITAISSLGTALLVVFFSINFGRYDYVILAKIFVPAFSLIFYLFFFLKKIQLTALLKTLDYKSLKSILLVSVPFGVASMLGTFSLYIDKFIVSSYSDVESFAIYVNGAIEIPLIGVLTGSVASVLVGEMSRKISENKLADALDLFKTSATKTALLLFPIMVFFLINSKEFMILMYSEKYSKSAIPFMIYLLLVPIRIVVFGSALIAMGKSKMILVRSLVELALNILVSILMFHLLGIWGVAIATVVVTYLWSVPFNLIEISKGFKVSVFNLFEFKSLLQIMAISILISPVILLIKLVNIPNSFILILSSIIFFTLVGTVYQRIGFINTGKILAFLNRK